MPGSFSLTDAVKGGGDDGEDGGKTKLVPLPLPTSKTPPKDEN